MCIDTLRLNRWTNSRVTQIIIIIAYYNVQSRDICFFMGMKKKWKKLLFFFTCLNFVRWKNFPSSDRVVAIDFKSPTHWSIVACVWHYESSENGFRRETQNFQHTSWALILIFELLSFMLLIAWFVLLPLELLE